MYQSCQYMYCNKMCLSSYLLFILKIKKLQIIGAIIRSFVKDVLPQSGSARGNLPWGGNQENPPKLLSYFSSKLSSQMLRSHFRCSGCNFSVRLSSPGHRESSDWVIIDQYCPGQYWGAPGIIAFWTFRKSKSQSRQQTRLQRLSWRMRWTS